MKLNNYEFTREEQEILKILEKWETIKNEEGHLEMYMYDFGESDPYWSSTNEIEDLKPIFNCIKRRSVPLYDKIKNLYEHSDSMSSFKEKMILIAQMSIKNRFRRYGNVSYKFIETTAFAANKEWLKNEKEKKSPKKKILVMYFFNQIEDMMTLDTSISRYYFWEEYCQCTQKKSLFLKEFLETHRYSMNSHDAERIVEELRKSF